MKWVSEEQVITVVENHGHSVTMVILHLPMRQQKSAKESQKEKEKKELLTKRDLEKGRTQQECWCQSE